MFNKTSERKKSPIKKEKLLRRAGQSLDEEIKKILDDNVAPYILMVTLSIMIAMTEWIHWYFNSPPMPLIFTAIAIAVTVFSACKLVKLRRTLKNLRQGSDGERSVAQYIELIRKDGMRVFHDIPGEDFNIDHLLVSKNGVYLVETKTYSKPLKGLAEVIFNGESLTISGKNYGNKEIIQVKAGSKWMEELLEELTAKKFAVKPVVVFPGWYVKMTKPNESNVWVLNPKGLDKFIMNQKETLTNEDVKLITGHLSRYISGKNI